MSILSKIGKSLHARCKTFLANDTGVTAIEFAFVGPVFIVLLVSILDTGIMLFTEYTLQSSVQDAARLIRTGQAQSVSMTAANFKNAICERTRLVIDCTNKVTVYVNSFTTFASLASSVPSYYTIGKKYRGTNTATPQPFKCGAALDSVALIATYDWEYLLPFMNSWMGANYNVEGTDSRYLRRIAAFAMFKNEPFPSVSGQSC